MPSKPRRRAFIRYRRRLVPPQVADLTGTPRYEWGWTCVAANNEIVASGWGFNSRDGARQATRAAVMNLAEAIGAEDGQRATRGKPCRKC